MTSDTFGPLLKQYRTLRRFSQLDLATEAEISSRHVSFMENGKSCPSREMILHLGRVLDMPLRDVNLMLAAAGYTAAFGERTLNDSDLASTRQALQLLLSSHEPFPAVVIDDQWNLLMANQAQQRFASRLMASGAEFPESVNLLDHFFAPGGYRDFVRDWQTFAVFLLQRIEKEAVLKGGQQKALIARLESYPDVPADWRQQTVSFADSPMLQLALNVDGDSLALFSTIAVFGTPLDVTLQGLRIEHYFPADEPTREFFLKLAST